jgi:hypothetical protein
MCKKLENIHEHQEKYFTIKIAKIFKKDKFYLCIAAIQKFSKVLTKVKKSYLLSIIVGLKIFSER